MASRLVGLIGLRLEGAKLRRTIVLGHKASIEMLSNEGLVSGYIPSPVSYTHLTLPTIYSV